MKSTYLIARTGPTVNKRSPFAGGRIMALWQYHTFKFSPTESYFQDGRLDEERIRGELDLRGEKGWELVGIFSSTTGQDMTHEVAIVFKRAVRT